MENGERIAQMIIARHEKAEFIQVDELQETLRGAGGSLLASSTAPKKTEYSAQGMGVGTSSAAAEIGPSTYGANR